MPEVLNWVMNDKSIYVYVKVLRFKWSLDVPIHVHFHLDTLKSLFL